MPTIIIPETKAEFDRKPVGGRTAELPWTKKELIIKPYRVLFNTPPTELLNKGFYFDNQKDFVKMRDYLKCNRLLEKGGAQTKSPSVALKQLHNYFVGQLVSKVIILYNIY